jgi:hypothetical protein
MKKNVEKQ